jgi:hypothetical protein
LLFFRFLLRRSAPRVLCPSRMKQPAAGRTGTTANEGIAMTTRARRIGRWVLLGIGGVLVLLISFRVGLGAYLATSSGKAMVARKITGQIGLPVEVTSVRVGLASSSIGLRVFDPAAPDPGKAEILAVEGARADVTLFDLAFGRVAPRQVELRGVNLTLHVAADGKVVTTLPTLPQGAGGGSNLTIKLTDGQVTIHQDGRPEFALQNLDLTAEPQGETVKLSGTIDDPRWSKWSVTGEVNSPAGAGHVELSADDAPMTMAGPVAFVFEGALC